MGRDKACRRVCEDGGCQGDRDGDQVTEERREPIRTWRAVAKANSDFIDLRTLSGYRTAVWDLQGKHYQFSLSVSDEELGAAVIDVLESSRFLDAQGATALRSGVLDQYEQWVATTMRDYGYSNRQLMFRAMRSCGLERKGNTIIITPTRHEKLEGWSGDGIDPEDRVTIVAGQPVNEIGASLRAAFERCL